MTIEKAIEILENTTVIELGHTGEDYPYQAYERAVQVAIKSLKKQISQKPIRIDQNDVFDGNWKKVCPNCGRTLIERVTTKEESYPKIHDYNHHCICGQTIDWKNEHE